MGFSATVTSPLKQPERISRSMGIFAGKCSISSYSQTLVALTGITKFFKPTGNATTGGFTHGICTVQIDGPSSAGYLIKWDYTTGAFKCFYVDASQTPVGVVTAPTFTGSAAVPTFTGSAVVPTVAVFDTSAVGVAVYWSANTFNASGGGAVNVSTVTPAGVVSTVTPAGAIVGTTFTGTALAAAAGVECAAGVDVGTFGFVAVGFI